ncbi:MAG: vanadium-dependent haloperoxidase [Acidimicrobiia bacterium]|nr:vanadium-dependent haloperoxidase [Acidimicrobiia bacterium]
MTSIPRVDDATRTDRHWKPMVAVFAAVVALLSVVGFVVARNRSASCDPSSATARLWNEATLDAIRRDFPAPTVHSRNLYHLSAAMWDVWAAYEPGASGVFVNGSRSAHDREGARSEAISYAAHRLLSSRYANAVGADESLAQFDQTLADLCFDLGTAPDPGSPGAFGVSVADAVLTATRDDGSLEASGYIDLSYVPVNQPLSVDEAGTNMADPNRWQPLSLEEQVTQNGQRIEAGVQEFIGPNWGYVTPFAIDPDPVTGLPFDPGPPPLLGVDEKAFTAAASQIVRFSSRLDTQSEATVDISPAVVGNTRLGSYEPEGWASNPDTGQPYPSNVVLEADYGRVIAEYWADGPDSETPPGHWNTLASEVGNRLEVHGGLSVDGMEVDRLEWDVKVGLALNGALHDSAIAAWGAKAFYDYARPISMIRYLGQRGQLEEVPGVIETITDETAAPGQRHVHLSDYIGEQAVYAWLGEPLYPEQMVGGVSWIRAARWVPYQRASFVTPSFAGYVSGHSAFSRAAAEVLTELTGSQFFPGGVLTHVVEPGGLLHEAGPASTIELQWATYRDAADQAGLSRLYGGIHVRADDLGGRRMGAAIGQEAVSEARRLFNRG